MTDVEKARMFSVSERSEIEDLARKVFAEMRAAEPAPCERNHCNGCKDPNGPRAAERDERKCVARVSNINAVIVKCGVPKWAHGKQRHAFQAPEYPWLTVSEEAREKILREMPVSIFSYSFRVAFIKRIIAIIEEDNGGHTP